MGKRRPSAIRWEPGIWRAALLFGACLIFSLILFRGKLSVPKESIFQKNHGGPDGPLPDEHLLTEKALRRSERVELPASKQAAIAVSGGMCKLGFEPGSIACCGHRGACNVAPENTLPAFQTAVELGANCLEMDVHMTADNGLVVMHERTMREKYSGGPKLPTTEKGFKRALAGWGFGELWGAQFQRRHLAAQPVWKPLGVAS